MKALLMVFSLSIVGMAHADELGESKVTDCPKSVQAARESASVKGKKQQAPAQAPVSKEVKKQKGV